MSSRLSVAIAFAPLLLLLSERPLVAQTADVRISSMTQHPETVTVGDGQNISYSISVVNFGPSAATGVMLSDTLDPSFTFVSATVSPPTQGSCNQVSGTVTCNLTTLGFFASTLVTIVVTPTLAQPSISNTATITANEPDPNPANNVATTAITVNAANADLRCTMSHSPDPVTLGGGQNLTYVLNLNNFGPSVATGVTLSDILDTTLTFVSATVSPPTQGSCIQSSGTITCNLNTLVTFSNVFVTIVATPTVAQTTIGSTATVTANEPDPNPANNSVTDTLTVIPGSADLRVTMMHSPEPVTLGQNLTYSITLNDLGPSTSTNVVLSDVLPDGVVFVSATPSQGSCSQLSGSVTCNIGIMPSTASVTIVVTPAGTGTTTNTANVSGNEVDPNPANNAATNSVTTVAGPPEPSDADLRMTLSHSPDFATLGSTTFIQYFATVFNGGPAVATEVTLTDTLPSNLTFAGFSVFPPTQGSCSSTAQSVTCNLNTLPMGGIANVTIYGSIASAGPIVSNTATVSATQNDPNPGNNTVTENLTINAPVADTRVTIYHSPDPLTLGAGQFLSYFVNVFNNGPSPATGVSLSDTLPPTATFAGFSLSPPTQGSCTQSSGVFSCNLNTLASFTGANVTIFVAPTTATSALNNTVSASANEPDPNPANNSSPDSVSVLAPSADVRVSINHSPDPAVVGQSLQYMITVSNYGPSPASGVVMTDTLPPVEDFQAAVVFPPTSGNCSQNSGTVTCNVPALAPGQNVSITIYVTPNTGQSVVSNTVGVSANEPDPIPANNSAIDNVTVNVTASPVQTSTIAGQASPASDRRATPTRKSPVYAITDLGPVTAAAGGPPSNVSGQSVGFMPVVGGIHAVMYGPISLTDLGTLGGSNSYAFAINSAGQIAGQSDTANGETHAFLYSYADGGMTDVGTLGGRTSSGWSLNEGGDVVGWSTLEGGYSHAFLYRDHAIVDLNSLIPADSGWDLEGAFGFGDGGSIIGYGISNGEEHMFLLTPAE
jgi:uncharacterized repeat protein (TIGR01451 family)